MNVQITSYNAMVVTVDGTGKHHLGLSDVLYSFGYECQKNNGHINRPNCKFAFFYVSGGPKKIIYWAIVERIIETDTKRIYLLECIMKLKRPIPLGTIPPNFSGGAIEIPLNDIFKIENMDDLYKYRVG